MKPDLSVIIPTKERGEILLVTLDSIKKKKKNLKIEIIVVNDSKNEKLVINDENVKIIDNPNQGAASARNYGASIAKADYLLFLDDDMIVCEDVLQEILLKSKENTKSIYLPNWKYSNQNLLKLSNYNFGRFLIKINYTSLEGWLGKKIENYNEVRHNGMASYFFLISKENFNNLNGYNPNFKFAGFEDHDMTRRLLLIGFNFYILPNLVLTHNETDRIKLKDWLNRRRRNAFTQKIAFELGYENLKINYSFAKKNLLLFVGIFDFIFIRFVNIFKNVSFLDKICFKIIDLLTALYIYKGYKYDYDKFKNKSI
ncbi:MAG: glycosyltransferase family 2 protein [Flavobacteriia bacterium]|nr:glycosyltransferase family 2 protein [Flavobacteriia bacterium]